jgi:hypothetical protein
MTEASQSAGLTQRILQQIGQLYGEKLRSRQRPTNGFVTYWSCDRVCAGLCWLQKQTLLSLDSTVRSLTPNLQRADMTSPRLLKLLLIACVSFSRSPVEPLCANRSEPAFVMSRSMFLVRANRGVLRLRLRTKIYQIENSFALFLS